MFSRGIEKQQRAVMGNPFHTFLPEGKIENQQKDLFYQIQKSIFKKYSNVTIFFVAHVLLAC